MGGRALSNLYTARLIKCKGGKFIATKISAGADCNLIKVIGVKYCGGCNPQIDRVAFVRELQNLLPECYKLVTDTQLGPWEIGVMVSGCSAACADRPEIRKLAKRWIMVSGSMVDSIAASEIELASIVTKKILELENE